MHCRDGRPGWLRREALLPWVHAVAARAWAVPLNLPLSAVRQPNAALPLLLRVDPARIEYRDALDNEVNGSRLVVDGDWDLRRETLRDTELREPRYLLPRELNLEGRALEATSEFRLHMERLASGRSSRKLTTRDEVLAYLETAREVDRRIRVEGYKSQAELGNGRFGPEVEVSVARDGVLMKRSNGGNHRFAMARFHRVPWIPVRVTALHPGCLEPLGGADSMRGGRGMEALRRLLAEVERRHR